MNTIARKSEQHGFSLVEIMVSLLISSLLIGGVVQIFLGSKESYRINESLGRIQENMRFANYMLGREIRKAAYKTTLQEDEIVFPADATFTIPGQVITGTDNNASAGDDILDGSDTVTLRYEGNDDGLVRDCLGASVATGVITTVKLWVKKDNVLQCEVLAPVAAGPQALSNDIGGLQFQYGVDSDADGSVNQYSSAAAVTDWLRVVSVRISTNFQSDNDDLKDRDAASVVALRNKLD